MFDVGSLRPPIFILGNPRSGTTLLRLMMTCHPSIVIPPECGFAVWLCERFPTWTVKDVPRFVDELLKTRKLDTWNLDRTRLLAFLREQRPQRYADACALVYAFYGLALGRSFRRWGDKNNFHLKHIDDILRLFPNAHFVHLLRDGRGVAASYLALARTQLDSPYRPQLPTEIGAIAEEWRSNVRATRARLAGGSAPYVEVRFESILEDPPRELTRLCAALGEVYDPAMLSYPEQNRRLGLEPADLLPWKERTLEAPDVSVKERWRTVLSVEEVATFEDVAGDILVDCGFLDR